MDGRARGRARSGAVGRMESSDKAGHANDLVREVLHHMEGGQVTVRRCDGAAAAAGAMDSDETAPTATYERAADARSPPPPEDEHKAAVRALDMKPCQYCRTPCYWPIRSYAECEQCAPRKTPTRPSSRRARRTLPSPASTPPPDESEQARARATAMADADLAAAWDLGARIVRLQLAEQRAV
jgi:hypothetical protein